MRPNTRFVPVITRRALLLVAPIACVIANADTISTVYVSLGPVPGVSASYSGYTTTFRPACKRRLHNRYVRPHAVQYRDTALDDISYVESSTDPSESFDSACSFSNSACGSTGYSASAVGILANGAEVAAGTAGTTDVNEIILTGINLGFNVTGMYSGTPQQQLDDAATHEDSFGDYSITTCFTDDADGLGNCGSVNVNAGSITATPEPSPLPLLALTSGIGLLFIRRLRRRNA